MPINPPPEALRRFNAYGNAGSALTVNAAAFGAASITLNAANCTLSITWPTGFTSLALSIVQDGTGGRLVTWPASILWPGGTEPVLSTTPGAVDEFILKSANGGVTVAGFTAGIGMS